jgi:hypothetical protein
MRTSLKKFTETNKHYFKILFLIFKRFNYLLKRFIYIGSKTLGYFQGFFTKQIYNIQLYGLRKGI